MNASIPARHLASAALVFAVLCPCLAQPTSTSSQTSSQTQTPPPKKTTKKLIDPNATAGVRGLGLPVTVVVKRHGKALKDVEIVVKTDGGVEISRGVTDAKGTLTLKLDAGDYTVSATTDDAERHITAHVAATANGTPTRINLGL